MRKKCFAHSVLIASLFSCVFLDESQANLSTEDEIQARRSLLGRIERGETLGASVT